MTDRETVTATSPVTSASVEEIQKGWHELTLRVGQLEAEKSALEQGSKSLRLMLDKVIEHRQKTHNELVLLLTGLVSKLPISDVGVLVSRLVEHNTNVNQYLGALVKGATDAPIPQPAVLKSLDQTKRDLGAAYKPLVEELLKLDPLLDHDLLKALLTHPDAFFSTRMIQANRCFLKGQVPRERIVREFGDAALIFFDDLTTDAKLNPRPKPDEIVLGFKNDFETLFEQNPGVAPEKRAELMALYQKTRQTRAGSEHVRAQRVAFLKLSFLLELLYFYENQNTEAPDVLFAQRLPAVLEQLAVGGGSDGLDEKLIVQAEGMLAFVAGVDHRHMIVNNVGKSGGNARTLKYVLKLRMDKLAGADHVVTEFVRHLIPPSPQKPPPPEALAILLRHLQPEPQRWVVKAMMVCDRMRRDDAAALGKAVGGILGLKNLEEPAAPTQTISPEVARQRAWTEIKESIAQRGDPTVVAATIRNLLNAKFDHDEIRQSWVVLTESDPLAFIRIFCQLPYLEDGTTDPIIRTVIETYVSRLAHEKYAPVYNKIVHSLRNLYKAKPDSPTLLNFVALVRWVSPETADKLCADVGMHVPA
jgi:hypothetical protein